MSTTCDYADVPRDHVGPIIATNYQEPLDGGVLLHFKCCNCDTRFEGAIDFDEMTEIED